MGEIIKHWLTVVQFRRIQSARFASMSYYFPYSAESEQSLWLLFLPSISVFKSVVVGCLRRAIPRLKLLLACGIIVCHRRGTKSLHILGHNNICQQSEYVLKCKNWLLYWIEKETLPPYSSLFLLTFFKKYLCVYFKSLSKLFIYCISLFDD